MNANPTVNYKIILRRCFPIYDRNMQRATIGIIIFNLNGVFFI